jgi:hypothetical protein
MRPAVRGVELGQEEQPAIRGGGDVGGEFTDLLAQALEVVGCRQIRLLSALVVT